MSTHSVVIADLGVGNLRSVARAVERAGGEATITADPEALLRAGRVIVPGQGAFRDCAVALERGFDEALRTVIARGTPYLGLCLGMQLLFEDSEEAPGKKGLAYFAGRVLRFSSEMRDATSGERRRQSRAGHGKESGDPARAAKAIIQISESPNPPLHLILGKPGLAPVRAKLKALLAEIDAWEAVSLSADFPPEG